MPPCEAFDAIHGGGVIAAMLLLLLLSMVIGWYVYLALMMPTNLIFHMGFSAWQKLWPAEERAVSSSQHERTKPRTGRT